MRLLTNEQMPGKDAVVVGRSNIVGMPAARLLQVLSHSKSHSLAILSIVHVQDRNATVTVCHSRTADLPAAVKRADIVIAAIGRAEMMYHHPLQSADTHCLVPAKEAGSNLELL